MKQIEYPLNYDGGYNRQRKGKPVEIIPSTLTVRKHSTVPHFPHRPFWAIHPFTPIFPIKTKSTEHTLQVFSYMSQSFCTPGNFYFTIYGHWNGLLEKKEHRVNKRLRRSAQAERIKLQTCLRVFQLQSKWKSKVKKKRTETNKKQWK